MIEKNTNIDFKELQSIMSYNHCHSEYSNLRMLDCIIKTENLVDIIVGLGSTSFCITDHASLGSHIRLMRYKKELNKQGIDVKIGYGEECYIVNSIEDCKNRVEKYNHAILVPKNLKGHEQLRRISSKAWNNSYYTGKMERVPIEKTTLEEIIGSDKGNLKFSSACLGGEFAQLVVNFINEPSKNNKLSIHKFVNWGVNLFGKENFFIEIQPSNDELQIAFNKEAVRIAKAYDLKVQVTTDIHYSEKSDLSIHGAYLNSRDGADRETEDFYRTTYAMTVEEIVSYLNYFSDEEIVEFIKNTKLFMDDVEDISLNHKTIVPERDLSMTDFEIGHTFRDWYDKCIYIKNFAYSEYEQDRFFLYMIEQGFVEKKQEFNATNLMRIDVELKELWEISKILKERMSSYYVLVDYIVDLIWEIGFVGVSRGSVAGFYTCYLIDIQQVNPIEWNLPHWRHITAERCDGLPKILGIGCEPC